MNDRNKEVTENHNNNPENKDLPIRSSTAEYLTYIASSGESENTFEVRYEDALFSSNPCGLMV